MAWSRLGTAVYWAAADGRVGVVTADGGAPSDRSTGAGPLGGRRCRRDDDRLVLVREQARPKVEAPLRQFPADPSEVVVFDRKKKATHILIPLGTAVWRSPAVSPDGKRLALISDSGHEGGWRACGASSSSTWPAASRSR